ncbi:MAG TPA: hypothetical protein VMD28_09615, partial [Acidimicrobiales bacterium]|nr:hypothetical protein [Acidimicrobiales bacterium]
HRAERVLAALPLLVVVSLVALALAQGPSFLVWMGAGTAAPGRASALTPWLLPSLVLALGALALVAFGPRLAPTRRGTIAACFVVVDLAVFVVTTVVAIGAPVNGPAAAATAEGTGARARLVTTVATSDRTSAVRPIAALHLPGRFAVYDPGLLYPSQLTVLGVPDENVTEATWSVQGYGSIVDGHYAAATGVHAVSGTGQDVFSPAAASDGVFDSLSTSAVLAPSPYLLTAGHVTARGPGARHVAAGGRATWYLGTPVQVRAAQLELSGTPVDDPTRPADVRVGLLTEDGAIDWGQARAPRGVTSPGRPASLFVLDVAWPMPVDAVGLVVDSRIRAVVSPPVVDPATGRPSVLDGVLQDAIVAPHFRYGGQDGAFAVFIDRGSTPPLSLRALPGGSLRGTAVRRVSGPAPEPTRAIVTSRHGVDVVRAVAAIPGWVASWTPSSRTGTGSGPTETLPVHRLGVVQVVRVPPGRGVLTWRYAAPGLLAGEVSSSAALALLLALVLLATARGIERRADDESGGGVGRSPRRARRA